ncbi:unnamed protein product [Camellia sinensis]
METVRNTEAKLCTAEQQAARTDGCASWIETVQQSESKKAFHPVNVKVCFASASAPNLVILLLVLPKVVEVEETTASATISFPLALWHSR